MPDRAVQRPPDFLSRGKGDDQDQIARAELLLDTHRVIGLIEQSGPPRRLVDILNAKDDPVVVVRDAVVEDLASPGDEPRRFGILHVKREAILLAIPISAPAPSSRGLETVEKRPAAATLVLPGLEVTGHVYLPPGADPGAVRLLGKTGFLPVTHAEVTQVAFGGERRREPLVVVNLGRAQLYAPALR